MKLLKRHIAPILPEAWDAIDEEARVALQVALAARVVDVDGPHGWELASVSTGKLDLLAEQPAEGVGAGVRRVNPVVELRIPFELKIMDLDSISRGAEDPDLDAVGEAARQIARAEDTAVFKGFKAGGVQGILETIPHDPIPFGRSPDEHLEAATQARSKLIAAGIGGPYALVLGSRTHREVMQAADDGYPLTKRFNQVLEGPIIESNVIEGGLLMSTRGGDFELTLGVDFSIGFVSSDRDKVELYLTSAFAFRTLEPAAAVALPAD
jgi:uncharacterized linocin/CFP29 family protein